MHHVERLRVLRPGDGAQPGERLLEHGQRGGEVAQLLQQRAQVGHRAERRRVRVPQLDAARGEQLLVEPARRGQVALRAQQLDQVVEGEARVRVPPAERVAPRAVRLLQQRARRGHVARAPEQPREGHRERREAALARTARREQRGALGREATAQLAYHELVDPGQAARLRCQLGEHERAPLLGRVEVDRGGQTAGALRGRGGTARGRGGRAAAAETGRRRGRGGLVGRLEAA